MLKHTMSRTLAVMGVVLALGVEGAAAETVLKLGTVGRLGMPIGDAVDQALIPTATELSGGRIVVEPHYRGSLCGEQKCGEQANQGLLQLWTSSTANFGNFGTALAIFDLPYIFKSIESADAVSAGWMSDAQCRLAAETTGHICFVVYSSGGFRELGNAERPVHTPDDMQGLKWRVTKSPIEYTLIKSWGAVPVPYDWTQLYQGLQTGVVSGQYVAIPWQYIAKLHEVAKYYTQIGGAWSGNQIAMDVAQYNALSPDEKKWIDAAAAEFGDMVRELDQKWVEDGIAAIKQEIEEWYVPTDEEMALWRAGAVGAWKDAKGTFDPQLAERALAEQGLDDFIATLKAAGAL